MCYLIEIENFVNGDPEAKAIYSYNTIDEATIAVYNTMSYAMSNDAVSSVLCEIINPQGFPDRREYWERPQNQN